MQKQERARVTLEKTQNRHNSEIFYAGGYDNDALDQWTSRVALER